MEKFAGYGFNKIALRRLCAGFTYRTLWLKAHYPAGMAAVMTADMDSTEASAGGRSAGGWDCFCRRMCSGLYHFPLTMGRDRLRHRRDPSVGEGPSEAIIDARHQGGYFRELCLICARGRHQKLNRRVLEKLIMSGAFDRTAGPAPRRADELIGRAR